MNHQNNDRVVREARDWEELVDRRQVEAHPPVRIPSPAEAPPPYEDLSN